MYHHRILFVVLALATLFGVPASSRQQAEEPASEGQPAYVNTLKWTTASEVDNFGYDVYRGDLEEGPFERVTEQPILGAGTTDEPQSYRWVDRDIDPTRAYYYYVESIDLSGRRERFTPIYRAEPKVGGEDTGEEARQEDPPPDGGEDAETSTEPPRSPR